MSSEKKAESLYGAAPEGDEAVDASREVPDPGESRSYATMVHPISVMALNGYHLGRNVKVSDGTLRLEGELSHVCHGASKIDERTLSGATSVVLGRRWVQVEVLGYGGARVSPEATVEFLS